MRESASAWSSRWRSARPAAGSLGLGAGLWWLVSNLLALAAGGYTAAWLAGNTLRFDGMLHGLVTWGVTLLLTFYLLTTALGGLIGGAFTMVGGVTSRRRVGRRRRTRRQPHPRWRR